MRKLRTVDDLLQDIQDQVEEERYFYGEEDHCDCDACLHAASGCADPGCAWPSDDCPGWQ